MKKLLAIAGLMTAAAIAFTGCRIDTAFQTESPSTSFCISASTGPDTKTLNEGMSTLWEAKDSVCVFYSSSPGVYDGGKGTILSGAKTTHASFQVEGVAPTGTVDWFMLFPYNKSIETPGAREEGWTYIGHSKGAEQAEYNSTSHLARTLCPMYGVARNADGVNVDVQMRHLASVIEFAIVNDTGLPIDAVKSVSVTASEDIVGSYFIDITGDAPVYTPSGEDFVNSTGTVNVKNPASLANGETAKLYLPIKPYTQSSSESFKIEVLCTVGGVAKFAEFEYVLTGGKAVFSAGKIKTVKVSLSSLADKLDSVEYAFASPSGTAVVLDGVVVSVFPKGFFVDDGTGAIFVYQNAAPTVTPGTRVRIEGKTGTNQHHIQISNTGLNVTETGTGEVARTPASWTGSDVEAAYEKDNNVAFVTLDATALSAARLSVEGTTMVLSTDVNHRAEGVSFTKGKKYTITGYVYGYGKNGDELQVCMYAETAVTEGGDDPGPGPGTEANLKLNGKNSESLTFAAAPTGPQTVTVTCDNANWTVTGAPDWVQVEEDKEDSKITVSVSENTGEVRSVDLSVNHSNGELTRKLTVTQAAASTGGEAWTRVTSVATLLAGGTFIIGYEATANSGLIIPMANTGSLTTSAAGYVYSGSTASAGDKTSIDMSAVSGSSSFEVVIEASTVVSGAVNIKFGDNYLGNTNTKNNAKLFTEPSATTAFTPTVGDNDVFTLTIDANETYKTLQYNTGSPRFAVYNGGQKNVVIYKKP